MGRNGLSKRRGMTMCRVEGEKRRGKGGEGLKKRKGSHVNNDGQRKERRGAKEKSVPDQAGKNVYENKVRDIQYRGREDRVSKGGKRLGKKWGLCVSTGGRTLRKACHIYTAKHHIFYAGAGKLGKTVRHNTSAVLLPVG